MNWLTELQQNQEKQIREGIREIAFPKPQVMPDYDKFCKILNSQTEKADNEKQNAE